MRIAVLSRGIKNYSTQRLVEAIEKAGHEAMVINHAKCYMDIEQNRPTIYYEGEKLKGIDVIIPRVGQSITEYGAAVVRQFEMMKVQSSIPSIALVRSRDKLRSLQLLARAGVGIPRTVFARQDADTESLIEMVGGAPLVVKLTEGTHGVGVVLAETRKAAKSLIEAFYGLGANILIQEYIDEAHGSDIRVIVVGDTVVGAMMRQGAEGEFRSNLHRGGTSIPVELSVKERNIAIKAARTLGLSIAGVDIIRSSRGPLILEVNSSPGLQGIERIVGPTVAESIIDYVLQQSGGRRRKDKIGA